MEPEITKKERKKEKEGIDKEKKGKREEKKSRWIGTG